jgi:hypothetical protein
MLLFTGTKYAGFVKYYYLYVRGAHLAAISGLKRLYYALLCMYKHGGGWALINDALWIRYSTTVLEVLETNSVRSNERVYYSILMRSGPNSNAISPTGERSSL